MGTTITIKNMVCNRCIAAVDRLLRKQGLTPVHVGLGEAVVEETEIPVSVWTALDQSLADAGFERLDDQRRRWIEKAKNIIIRRIHYADGLPAGENWSDILTAEIPLEYGYLSSLFSSVEGTTLEQFVIRQKIERVKEWLFYDEMSLSQMADALGYSSVAHLSAQFKKVTGITPTGFKKQRPERKSLDEV